MQGERTIGKVYAPWTDEQVACLNRWQAAGRFHPFTCTCGNHVVLVATSDGWVCPNDCGYTQDWAHDCMAGGEVFELMMRGPGNG